MSSQNSIISYTPQPYYIEGSCAVTDYVDVASIENSSGILDPNLSNYTTFVADPGVSEFGFRVWYDRDSDYLATSNVTVALVGCSLLTYADDGGGNPDLDTEFSEDIVCAFAGNTGTEGNQVLSYSHNSQNTINTLCKQPMRGIISGGNANLVFRMGTFRNTTTDVPAFIFPRSAVNVAARPHAKLIVGHLFIGTEIPVIIDPQTFAWTIEAKNERFIARDSGTISSDGTLIRQAAGEIIKINHDSIIGSVVTDVASDLEATAVANFFDMTKANNSYPVLFDAYPRPPLSINALTVADVNLTARQNFFSIYGFMDGPLELRIGEFRDGINTEYKARFRIRETR